MTKLQLLALAATIEDMSDSDDLLMHLLSLPTLCVRIDAGEDDPERSANGASIFHDDTLLHYIIATREDLEVSLLSAFFNHGVPTTVLGNEGRSLVHAAAASGHLSTIHHLMALGCQLVARDDAGATPFHIAAHHGHVSVLKYFVETVHVHVNIVNASGRTAMHYAAENNHVPALVYLVSQGADMNALNGNDRTPMHLAVPHGHLESVQYLLSLGATTCRNVLGDTIIHDAAQHNQVAIMEYFVSLPELAPHATWTNLLGQTPLHVAAAYGAKEVFVILNGNPWGERHSGLMQDIRGTFPLPLLLQSHALAATDDVDLLPYVPRNAKTDMYPLWNDGLFAQVLRQAPSFAWRYLDVFKVPVSWAAGRTEWQILHMEFIEGSPRDIESSALYTVLRCYDDPNKERRDLGLRLLNHTILTRVMHIKWKVAQRFPVHTLTVRQRFGRSMYCIELACSSVLLVASMICIILSKEDPGAFHAQFYAAFFVWATVVTYSIGAMAAVVNYENIKRWLQGSAEPGIKDPKRPRHGLHSVVLWAVASLQGRPMHLHNPSGGGLPQSWDVSDATVVKTLAVTLGIYAVVIAATIVGAVKASVDSTISLSHVETALRDINTFVRLVLAIGLLGLEFLECYGSPSRYLRTLWNYGLVVIYLTLIFVGTPLDAGWVTPASSDDQPCVFAVITLFLWINYLQILRVHRWTGPMITMVLRMLHDVRNFLLMYTVFQMGLSCCYYALLQGQEGFETFSSAFITTLFVMFAQIPIPIMLGQPYPRQYFVTACLALHCFVVNTVLLNALIAVLTTTVNDVLEQVQEQVLYNHAESILRADLIVPNWIRARWRGHAKLSWQKTVIEKDEVAPASVETAVSQLDKRLDKCIDDIAALRVEMVATKDEMRRYADKTQETLDILVALASQGRMLEGCPRASHRSVPVIHPMSPSSL
ncbi:hypothetical protein ACHHYP_02130 [Achlya hypogyna]|uniref:Ion transport domain-containing protein n=1 Tax=Achlya hypogyna TaxID=1202772 RepID=A0A1V9Z7A0_ACHHY|nr:hypothetical protein ACHHYP_02130 [Achlya hypogyna]